MIYSETILRIDYGSRLPFYALICPFYSPENPEERAYTMVEETARYFRMMGEWAAKNSNYMRILEELDIPSENLNQAQEELDEILRAWADKYHQKGGETMVLQMMFGFKEN